MGEAGEAIEETGEMSRVRDKRAPESTGSVAAADGMAAFEDSSEVRGDFIPLAAELTCWSPGKHPWRPSVAMWKIPGFSSSTKGTWAHRATPAAAHASRSRIWQRQDATAGQSLVARAWVRAEVKKHFVWHLLVSRRAENEQQKATK